MTATFVPAPGAAPLPRQIAAQVAFETRIVLRHAEQVLLTVVIPVILLVLLNAVPVLDTAPTPKIDFLVPGVLALAVMSTSFTSLAIMTGFERRYGVLKRLAASPLPRWGLLVAKTGTVLAVQSLQVALIGGLGLALGWRPHGSALVVAALLLAGTFAFGGLALLMAGTLRAEATLAGANAVYLLLLGLGGIFVPLDRFPAAAQPFLEATPAGALVTGLRSVLVDGSAVPWASLGILVAWAVVGFAAAARWFRWE